MVVGYAFFSSEMIEFKPLIFLMKSIVLKFFGHSSDDNRVFGIAYCHGQGVDLLAKNLEAVENCGRSSNRIMVKGRLPASIICPVTERIISQHPRILDVSPRGLGLMVSEAIEQRQKVLLRTESHQEFCFEVIHCQMHLGIAGLYRCGLFLRSGSTDLQQEIFRLGFQSLGEVRRPLG
jgi:hypothetical protein